MDSENNKDIGSFMMRRFLNRIVEGKDDLSGYDANDIVRTSLNHKNYTVTNMVFDRLGIDNKTLTFEERITCFNLLYKSQNIIFD